LKKQGLAKKECTNERERERDRKRERETIDELTGLLTFCAVVKWGGLETSHDMETGHSLLLFRSSCAIARWMAHANIVSNYT
jgi:hypothetical protein